MFFDFQKEKSTRSEFTLAAEFRVRSSFETAGVFDPTDIRDPGGLKSTRPLDRPCLELAKVHVMHYVLPAGR